MMRAVLTVLLLAISGPAAAGLTRAQLSMVGVFPPHHASLPLDLSFHDLDGKWVSLHEAIGQTPFVLLFVDFTCHTLCGPVLEMTSAALLQTHLEPAKSFHLIVIGMDPTDTAAEARAFVLPQLDPKISHVTRVLLGNTKTVAAATASLGFRYVYDREHDQFAHPTAAFVLTKTGGLNAVLSALGLRGIDLRLALVSASEGAVGTIADRLRLLCYCYDPETGIYSASIGWLVNGAASLTALTLGGGILLLRRLEKAKRR